MKEITNVAFTFGQVNLNVVKPLVWSSLTESLSRTRKYAVFFHNVVTNLSVSHRTNRLNSVLFHWTSTSRGAKSDDENQTIFGVLAEKAECLCQWAVF